MRLWPLPIICRAHTLTPLGSPPRNLRRMRDFYRAYESAPEVMAGAMAIGWTQNVVILEADLTLQEKVWYIRAVQTFGWAKLELAERIKSAAHLELALDLTEEVCYTGENDVTECTNDDKDPLYLPQEYHEKSSKINGFTTGRGIYYTILGKSLDGAKQSCMGGLIMDIYELLDKIITNKRSELSS